MLDLFFFGGYVPAVFTLDGGRLDPLWLLFTRERAISGERLGVEFTVVGGEAFAGGKLKLPAVHGAGEDAVLYFAEAREIGLEVGAAALDAVAVAFTKLVLRCLLRVVAFDILDAFWREALEKDVNVFVVWSLALRFKATGEEEVVDPVLDVANDAGLDEGGVYLEAVLPLFVMPWIDFALLEIDDHRLLAAVDEQAAIDADTGEVRVFQQWLEPVT